MFASFVSKNPIEYERELRDKIARSDIASVSLETTTEFHLVQLFAYGGGWRVKYIITDLDVNYTHVLDYDDTFYNDLDGAIRAFNNTRDTMLDLYRRKSKTSTIAGQAIFAPIT